MLQLRTLRYMELIPNIQFKCYKFKGIFLSSLLLKKMNEGIARMVKMSKRGIATNVKRII